MLRFSLVWFASILILIFGTVVYYRSGEELIGIHWLSNSVPRLHQFFIDTSSGLPEIFTSAWSRFYLPDVCWSLAISMAVASIWLNVIRPSWIYVLCVSAAISFEFAQGVGWIRGTFDIFDLLLSLVAGSLGFYYAYWVMLRSKKTKQSQK